MPPCARAVMDMTSGGPAGPPAMFPVGSTKVLCNNMGVLTVGCSHIPNPLNTGPYQIVAGSGTVFAENKPIARLGDMDSCPECIATGSGNVIVGG